MGILTLAEEPNKRAHQIRNRIQFGIFLSPLVVGGALCAINTLAGLFVGMTGFFIAGPSVAFFGKPAYDDPTPRIPDDLMASPRRISSLLATASRHGMSPMDRIVANAELERTVDALTRLCGKEPWIAAGQIHKKVTGLDDHLKIRADRLTQADYLFDLVEERTGAYPRKLIEAVAYFVPLLASVATDFGLDTTGLTPTTARVAGQVLGEPIPISHMSESLHRLASEWRDGANDLVDPLTRIDADAAAGRDLRALENAWAVARSDAPPELVDDVDERFGKAAATLSATLADAIALRGRAQMQTLEIEARYVETKHAA